MARFKPDTRLDRLFKKHTWPDRWFHWGQLRRFGKSRLVASSWLWLFLVPAAAKLLGPFAGEHDVTVTWLPDGRNVIHVDIGLLFSWKFFYAMSLAFALGQFNYWWKCPEIVQRYGSYGGYLATKGDNRVALGEMMALIFRKRRRRLNENEQFNLIDLLPPREAEKCRDEEFFRYQFEHLLRRNMRTPDFNCADVFDVFLSIEERSVFWAFCVSGLAFLLGLGLFLYVVVENLIAVCRLL